MSSMWHYRRWNGGKRNRREKGWWKLGGERRPWRRAPFSGAGRRNGGVRGELDVGTAAESLDT